MRLGGSEVRGQELRVRGVVGGVWLGVKSGKLDLEVR